MNNELISKVDEVIEQLEQMDKDWDIKFESFVKELRQIAKEIKNEV